ncbi:MAG: hypothetical protein OHK0040_04170 [bacterium]
MLTNFLNNRKNLVLLAVIVLLPIFLIGFLSYQTTMMEKEVAKLKLIKDELSENSANLTVMAQSVKVMQKRMEEGKTKNFVSEIERIANDLNISKNFKKANALGNKKEGILNVNRYELKYEGIDLNTLTNLIYRVLNTPMLVRVERCNISVSFDNPNLFNMSLTVAHIN